jgi:hypothetical protein
MLVAQKSRFVETMPLRLRRALTSVAIGLTAVARVGGAETPSGAPSADAAAAQALFERGRQLMAEQRAPEACPLFEESHRLEAGIGTQFNLASCYEAVGRFASAHTVFLDVAAASRARGQEQRAQAASARARAVELKISRIVIQVEPAQQAALTVERDGSIVGAAQWGLAVPVDPGEHEIRAYGPGFVPFRRVVDVGTSPRLHTVQIAALPLTSDEAAPCDLERGECEPPADAKPARTFWEPLPHRLGLAALSVGVVSLGVSTGFALHAASKNSRSEAAGCGDRGCPDEEGLALRREAVSAGNWATVAAGAGLAGIAAAGILFWVVPEPAASSEPTARISPRVGNETAGIEFYGRF